MKYLLDTNICIAVLRSKTSKSAIRLAAESAGQVCVCSVVKAELYYGARKGNRRAENLQKLAAFLNPFYSLPFDSDRTTC